MTNARRALPLAENGEIERGAQHPRIRRVTDDGVEGDHTARVYTATRKHVNTADGHDSSAVHLHRRRH